MRTAVLYILAGLAVACVVLLAMPDPDVKVVKRSGGFRGLVEAANWRTFRIGWRMQMFRTWNYKPHSEPKPGGGRRHWVIEEVWWTNGGSYTYAKELRVVPYWID